MNMHMPTGGRYGEIEHQNEGIRVHNHRDSLWHRLKRQCLLQPRSIQILIFGLCTWFIISILVICAQGSKVNTSNITDLTNINAPITSNPTPRKPIVLFIHLHKAGGTRIIKSFKASNNYKFYESNANGNPQRFSNNTNKFWDISFGRFDEKKMIRFRDELNEKKVTFIAMESHFFKHDHFEIMQKLNTFDTFTMIRNPLTRIISNYFYDVNGQFYNLSALDKFDTLDDKIKWFCQDTHTLFNHNNYYVRFLNGLNVKVQIKEKHFERAKVILSKFDAIGILEFEHTWHMIQDRYHIKLKDLEKINSHKNEHENPTTKFEKWFKKENKWDFKLYDYAVRFSGIARTV